MPISPGSKIGPYEIVAPLGAGGMGEVYRATQSNLGRQIALKILSPDLAANAERLRRFEQEARAASALNHPNIVSIYDIGREGATAFIAMELVDGKTLRALFDSGPLPIKRTLQIAIQIADGLAKAHAAGIVHRDLKPENVMVTRDGLVKILDFGLAKLIPVADSSSDTLTAAGDPGTNPGVVMGTVGYMSPEQARGAPVDFRSDVFAFGSLLYEMLTGNRPFKGESSAQTMAAIIEDDPKPIAERNPKVPAPLRWIVERCLAKDPEERYASTRDLARDLASIRDHLSESASAVAIEQPARSHSSAQTWLNVAAWTLGVALVGFAVGWFLPHPAAAPPVLHTLTFSGHDSDPTVSPDGRSVAFISDRDGTPRIWLKQFETGSETALSEGPDAFPRFSPDGAWILFIRNSNLYRMPGLGGDARKLLDNIDSADWSPDGKEIAFVRRQTDGSKVAMLLGIASAQDGSSHIIHRFENQSWIAPAWSPDGSTIALVQESLGVVGGSERYVLLVSADGKTTRKLVSPWPGGVLSAAAWSGSGRELVYSEPESVASAGAIGSRSTSTVGVSTRVILQNVSTGKARILLSLSAPLFRIEIPAPGRMIFDSLAQRNNLKEVGVPGSAPAGFEEHWLTRGYSIDRQPYYAPDGKSVIFSTSRSGDVDLWEVSTSTNALRRLTDHPTPDWDPFVTRDNQHLFWSSNRSGHFEIWMADRDGSSPTQVSHDGVDAENPTATPDGWVFYASGNPQHAGLWKVRSDGSQETQLLAGFISWPDVSPDGASVLYHVPDAGGNTATIGVVRVADGAKVPFEARGLRARFSPDGHAIIYERYSPQMPNGEIVSQPFPSSPGTPAKVLISTSPDYAIETFQLSPDGTRAVVSYADPTRSLGMADGVAGVEPPKRQ